MNYFGGISFDSYDHLPTCPAWIDRCFPHYYALNYAHSGRIRWALNNGGAIILNAPVAWWTVKGNHPVIATDGLMAKPGTTITLS